MARGEMINERIVPHEQFRVSVMPTEMGYEAWIERADRGLVSCGYSLSQACGTHEYATAAEAHAAAIQAIDTGEVRLNP